MVMTERMNKLGRGAKEKKDWRVQMSLVKREGTWKETTLCNKINTPEDGKWR